MINLKTKEEIDKIRVASQISAGTLDMIQKHIRPGITTEYIDKLCHDFIISKGGIPACLGYNGFPKSVCTSVNEVICHGVPSNKVRLKNGDIVAVDVTTIVDGYHGDTCRTFTVGKVSAEARDLVNKTFWAMMAGIRAVKVDGKISDIGDAIELYISQNTQYSVVKEFVGHGIGKKFHEAPQVPHYKNSGANDIIVPGMVFTIEPMINEGLPFCYMDDSQCTIGTTVDGKYSAQFEHTIAVHNDGTVEILTQSLL